MSATIRGMIKDRLITHPELIELGTLFISDGKNRIHFIREEKPHDSEVFRGLAKSEIARRSELLDKAHDVGLLLFVPTPQAVQSTGYYTIRPAFFPLVRKYVEGK